MRKAGVPVITNHAMRGSFASQLLKMGVDIETIQRFLGHKDIAITFEYLKRFKEEEAGDPLVLMESQTVSSWLQPSKDAQVIPMAQVSAQFQRSSVVDKIPDYVAPIGRPRKQRQGEFLHSADASG